MGGYACHCEVQNPQCRRGHRNGCLSAKVSVQWLPYHGRIQPAVHSNSSVLFTYTPSAEELPAIRTWTFGDCFGMSPSLPIHISVSVPCCLPQHIQRIFPFCLSTPSYTQDVWYNTQSAGSSTHPRNSARASVVILCLPLLLLAQVVFLSRTTERAPPRMEG